LPNEYIHLAAFYSFSIRDWEKVYFHGPKEGVSFLKRFILLFLSAFLWMPSFASAHTKLTSSNPQEGQVITKDLREITLTFGGNIEKLSTMELLKEGKEIPLGSIHIQGANMIGPLKVPLDNGTYKVEWKIAGQDGHPISGDMQFEVKNENVNQDPDTPSSNQEPSTPEEEQQVQTLTNQNQVTASELKQTFTNKMDQQTEEKSTEKSSNNVIIAIFIGLLVILLVGFLLLLRKK
jgi:copper resistance protein C